MKCTRMAWPVVALLAGFLLAAAPPADSREAPAAKPLPSGPPAAPGAPLKAQPAAPLPNLEDLRDAAFDRYIDLYLLGKAWDKVDPALLADCGLQLAEGERVLLRPHKGIPAERVLALAVKAAADRHDVPTLDRLAKAAERDGRKELASQVTAAKKLAGAARAADPTATVFVEEMTPEQYGAYRSLLLDLEAARLAGDGPALGKLEAQLPTLTGVGDERRGQLKKLLAEARSALPEKDDQEAAAFSHALQRLKLASRDCCEPAGTPADVSCFVASTLVCTPTGKKRIDQFTTGDSVVAFDEAAGVVRTAKVARVLRHDIKKSLFQIEVGDDSIKVTGEHVVYVVEKGWIPVRRLAPGDRLQTREGATEPVTHIWLETSPRETVVYNLEVEDCHTYYVGHGEYLVHNGKQ